MLDVDCVIAGLLGDRACGEILTAVRAGEVLALSTFDVEEEYRTAVNKTSIRRLREGAGMPGRRLLDSLADFIVRCRVVFPTGVAPAFPDEDRRKFLHCAFAANADFLVTRDVGLLEMESVGDTRIVTPAGFLAAFEASSR